MAHRPDSGKETTMPQCSVCNSDNPENAKFCNQCGDVFPVSLVLKTQQIDPMSLPSATPTGNRATSNSISYKLAKWAAIGLHPEAWPAVLSKSRLTWAEMDFRLKVVLGAVVCFVILF